MRKPEPSGLFGRRPARWVAYVCSLTGIICSILVLFPEVQKRIISLAELYMIHRKVNFYDQWMRTLSAWARGCLSIILAFDFLALTPKGRSLFREITKEMEDRLSKINFRPFIKPFLFVSGVYLFGYMSIIRADFSYVDDLARAVDGYHGWNGWSRHIADILSTFIHGDSNLTDISPLPQMLAALIAGAATILLVFILCGGEFPFAALLAGISLGLFPYFLENMSYKFDAPYMALSVFFSILPFVFIDSKKAFVSSSIASLLIMCMTYQASSGIYIVLALTLCFRDWNWRRKPGRALFWDAAFEVGSFCFAMLFFRLVFMLPSSGSGLSTDALSPAQLIPGILSNWKKYIAFIHDDFGLVWKILIMALCVLFICHTAGNSRQKKGAAFLGSLAFVTAAFFLSYGVYCLLKSPSYAPRALFGFGVFTAIVGVCCVSFIKLPKIADAHSEGAPDNKSGKRDRLPGIRGASGSAGCAVLCVVMLNWCFLAFAFSYGNALADQKRYTNFRVAMLLHDLSSLFPGRDKSEMSLDMENMIGFGPVTENIAKHYPIIKRLVPSNRHYHVYIYLSDYFHWGRGRSENAAPPDMPVLLDSYYHVIKSDGEHIRVAFKN
jgi:hypothetical protein